MSSSAGIRLNYDQARELLSDLFEQASEDYREQTAVLIPTELVATADVLFASSTQSYREVLLGCGLARLCDRAIDIRLPYINQGEQAFNGRTLDEQVVNPFLHDRRIPSSKGPYLATFRRNVQFVAETAKGVRDKAGYQALLDYLSEIESAESNDDVSLLLRYLLYRFVALRDASDITLAKVARLSLSQYETLIDHLLQTPSGGLLPVLLAVAMFTTLKNCFGLDWEIDWQGINVADRASNVGGDITIKSAGKVLLAIEVTERPIERSRVVSTFNTKISPHGIEDYLFFTTVHLPGEEARSAAMQYFAQGHDVSFLQVKPWLINNLGTVGARCRSAFTLEFVRLLGSPDVPAALKVKWNDIVKALLT